LPRSGRLILYGRNLTILFACCFIKLLAALCTAQPPQHHTRALAIQHKNEPTSTSTGLNNDKFGVGAVSLLHTNNVSDHLQAMGSHALHSC
jgi:hypothetical protein